MELDKKIFENKTLGDLIKEAYEKQNETDLLVKDKIDQLSSFITSPGDAIVLMPLIKDLIDSNLENNSSLMKIVNLFKQPPEKKSNTEDSTGLLTERDIQQLFEEVSTSTYIISEPKKITNNQ
jgi:hypothetical protein